MKKTMILLSGALALMLGSCNNKAEKAEEAEEAPVVEETTVATTSNIDPFIAQLQANDSTVMVTPSGLGYKIIKQTRGVTPGADATVNVKYVGKHADGTEFDSSKGEAVAFPLNRVIKGFSEGIQLMPMGSTYEFYIPGNLGYGEQGIPGVINPNELLIFEVELVDFDD